MNEGIISKIIKEAEKSEDFQGYLKWLRLRCVLECECKYNNEKDEGEQFYEAGDKLFEGFLKDYLGEELFSNGQNPQGIIEELRKVPDDKKKEFEKKFYAFLENSEIDENEVNCSWKKKPKHFIRDLAKYRRLGGLDFNQTEQLMAYAANINNDPLRYIYEIIQNADDCEYTRAEGGKKEVKIVIFDDRMVVSYPEDGMSCSDIIAITTIGQSNKRKKKVKRIIGEKGKGFKTIFSVCDCVEVHSGPFHFGLTAKDLEPTWLGGKGDNEENILKLLDENNEEYGTTLVLHFRKDEGNFTVGNTKDLFDKIKERYGFKESNNILKNCPILFTNKINCLSITYSGKGECAGECVEIRKKEPEYGGEAASQSFKSGTVTISYSDKNGDGEVIPGSSLNCYWFEKSVKFTFDEYQSHYKEVFQSEEEFNENPAAGEYPVVLIAPVPEELVKEDWSEKKGNLITYLPTFTNINAPISIQIPFELNEDRSSMWIYGMKGEEHEPGDYEEEYGNKEPYTTKWNRRLFDEVFCDKVDNYNKVVNYSLIKLAYEKMNRLITESETEITIYDYLPDYQGNDYHFFASPDAKYDDGVNKMNQFCGNGKENIIFQTFKSMKILKLMNGGYGSFNDNPVIFDKFVSSVINMAIDKAVDKEEVLEKALSFLKNKKNEKNAEAAYQLLSDRNLLTDGNLLADGESKKSGRISKNYEIVKVLGVQEAKIFENVSENDSENVKVEFANMLLELEGADYDGVSNVKRELEKDNKKDNNKLSKYLPKQLYRANLKAIAVQDGKGNWEWKAPKDAELWLPLTKEAMDNQWNNPISPDEKNLEK